MSLRHAILGVLEYQPLHGYALKCVLEQGISYFWPVNLAAIYPSWEASRMVPVEAIRDA